VSKIKTVLSSGFY